MPISGWRILPCTSSVHIHICTDIYLLKKKILIGPEIALTGLAQWHNLQNRCPEDFIQLTFSVFFSYKTTCGRIVAWFINTEETNKQEKKKKHAQNQRNLYLHEVGKIED